MHGILSFIERVGKKEVLIFLAFSFWLCFEYVLLGQASYTRTSDHLDSFAFRSAISGNPFSGDEIHFWQYPVAFGIDRLSNMASFAEIGNWLYSLLPGWLATGIILMAGSFLGAWFIFRLCKEMFGLSQEVSVIAGLAFAYSLAIVDISPYILGLSIVPAMLYYVEKIFFTPHSSLIKKYALLFVIGILFSLFTSLILTLPFSLVILVIWFIFIRKKFSWPFVAALLIFMLPALLLRIQEVWSLLINLPLSQRGSGVYYTSNIMNYFTYVKERVWQNYLTLSVVLGGLLFLRKKEKVFFRLLALIFLFVFIAPAYRTFASAYGATYFPAFSDFDFSRFYLFIPLIASVAMAMALEMTEGKQIILQNKDNSAVRTFDLKKNIIKILVVLLLISTLSLKLSHAKIWYKSGSFIANTFSPDVQAAASYVSDAMPYRVATISSDTTKINSSLPAFQGLESADGYADMTSNRSIEFYRLLAKDPSIKSDFKLLDQKTKLEIDLFKKNPSDYISTPLLSLSNVRFLFSAIPLSASSDFSLLSTPSTQNFYDWGKMSYREKLKVRVKENFSGHQLLAYENTDAFPRFFLARNTQIFSSKHDALTALENATTSSLRTTVILESADLAGLELPKLYGTEGSIDITRYSGDTIGLTVSADGPALMVITNNYSPSWTVRVNGKTGRILPAYHTFMAVPLDEKNNEVLLTYDPPYRLKNWLLR